jgi:hypothetical protein
MRDRVFFIAASLFVLMVITMTTGIGVSSAAAGTAIPPDYLRNVNSGRCLSLVNTGSTNGTVANQWDCIQNNGQRWRFFPVGPNASTFETQKYQIRSMNPAASNKCLSLNENEGYGNGSHFLLWECLGAHNAQSFTLHANAQGSYYIKLASTGKCLGVDNSAVGNTVGGINQWDCLNAVSQRWKPISQESFAKPLTGAASNNVLHGPPYDNPWATDLFTGSANSVKVVAGGTVRVRGTNANASCGYFVRIEDPLGFNYLYCHGASAASASTFAVGEYVPAGTHIFNRGSTGTNSPHLHFEIMWRPPNVPISGFSLANGNVPYCAISVTNRLYANAHAVPSQRRAVSGSLPGGGSGLGGNCDDAPY